METRANYLLIGLFTLASILGAFGFVYWFNTAGGAGERTTYRVLFEGSVAGLRTGSAVQFNGIRVGEVTDLRLDPAQPRKVVAVIAVDKSVPVRTDTQVGLDYQGLTGAAAVSMKGGSDTAPPLADGVLTVDNAGQDVTQAARDMLRRLDALVADNEAVLRVSIKNIEAFTNTLAGNSARIEHILAGTEALIGGNPDQPGELTEAARSIRAAADNLDKRTGDIATGLARFTNSGLKEWERLAIDGRRTLAEVERTFKNIDRNPSRLLWGGGASTPTPAPDQPAATRR